MWYNGREGRRSMARVNWMMVPERNHREIAKMERYQKRKELRREMATMTEEQLKAALVKARKEAGRVGPTGGGLIPTPTPTPTLAPKVDKRGEGR